MIIGIWCFLILMAFLFGGIKAALFVAAFPITWIVLNSFSYTKTKILKAKHFIQFKALKYK